MGKKPNLKATFSNFQEKQRGMRIRKAMEAAKKDVVKKSSLAVKSNAKSRGKRLAGSLHTAKPSTIPIAASNTILLIGEGNFSFARALFTSGHDVLAHLPPQNVTATTYDLEEACYEKYPDAREIVEELKGKGVMMLFGVDARRLETCKELKKRKWQRVVWNFPHAGKGISDQDRNVLSNQLLLLDFLKSVAPLLEDGAIPLVTPSGLRKNRRAGVDSEDEDDPNMNLGDKVTHFEDPKVKERGTVLITLRNGPPYTLWDLSRLAKKPSAPHVSSISPSIPYARYIQLRSFAFQQDDWKGYEHRMTKGWVEGLGRGRRTGKDKIEDRTWEFCLAD
ncbi:hypothetical protein K439DRAFT_1384699 [Ramaria rubella]|nr:hypothetical protein K439DRAFT_1384699 [Ramaria rubella]